MSAVLRRHYIVVAIDALSRARTPGTSSTDLEMTGTADLGVFVAEEWIGKVFEVQRVSNRIILVKLIVGQYVNTILFVNAPQSGLVMRLRTYSLIAGCCDCQDSRI